MQGSGFRGSGSRFMVHGLGLGGYPQTDPDMGHAVGRQDVGRTHAAVRPVLVLFRVSGLGFRVSGFGSRVSVFGSRASVSGSRVSGSGSRFSPLGFRVYCVYAASERRGGNLKGVKRFYPTATARVWPGLSYVFQVRATAVSEGSPLTWI